MFRTLGQVDGTVMRYTADDSGNVQLKDVDKVQHKYLNDLGV